MAEGRGGVVKLSFTTDLVSNIADCYCPECRVVVELERGQTLTTYLKELRIRVMRSENRAVFESLELELLESRDHTTPAFGHRSSC